MQLQHKTFFWPIMQCEANGFIRQCCSCQRAKGYKINVGLYKLPPIRDRHWTDISMDFMMGFTSTVDSYDLVLVVVDKFSKMAFFFPCRENSDVAYVAKLYFPEIVRLHGIPMSIVNARDVNFTILFGKLCGTCFIVV